MLVNGLVDGSASDKQKKFVGPFPMDKSIGDTLEGRLLPTTEAAVMAAGATEFCWVSGQLCVASRHPRGVEWVGQRWAALTALLRSSHACQSPR